MPQANPIGGLSLVIHILINILVFLYKKTVKFFNYSNKNFVSRYFSFLINKKGDTKVRRILSYLIVLLVSTTMSANLIYVTAKLTNTDITYQVKKIEQSFQQIINNTETNNNTSYLTMQDISTKESDEISLVDFMKNSGIVDTSFDSRARLALKFGITDKLDSYKGTPLQNRLIVQKLNEGRMVLPSN